MWAHDAWSVSRHSVIMRREGEMPAYVNYQVMKWQETALNNGTKPMSQLEDHLFKVACLKKKEKDTATLLCP